MGLHRKLSGDGSDFLANLFSSVLSTVYLRTLKTKSMFLFNFSIRVRIRNYVLASRNRKKCVSRTLTGKAKGRLKIFQTLQNGELLATGV